MLPVASRAAGFRFIAIRVLLHDATRLTGELGTRRTSMTSPGPALDHWKFRLVTGSVQAAVIIENRFYQPEVVHQA
jgi:hypothetical protein